MVVSKTVRVSKLSAARRQLDCAIEMWFMGKDEVSVHTLAGAAHQIIFDIHRMRAAGKEMLFDSLVIRDEYRKEFVDRLKRDVNFFKHADKDPDPVGFTEFYPETTEIFFLFSIIGLENLGEQKNDIENLFLLWFQVHHPNSLREDFKRQLEETGNAAKLAPMRQMSKTEFFKTGLEALAFQRTYA